VTPDFLTTDVATKLATIKEMPELVPGKLHKSMADCSPTAGVHLIVAQ
jgi:hypothetical protein